MFFGCFAEHGVERACRPAKIPSLAHRRSLRNELIHRLAAADRPEQKGDRQRGDKTAPGRGVHRVGYRVKSWYHQLGAENRLEKPDEHDCRREPFGSIAREWSIRLAPAGYCQSDHPFPA